MGNIAKIPITDSSSLVGLRQKTPIKMTSNVYPKGASLVETPIYKHADFAL